MDKKKVLTNVLAVAVIGLTVYNTVMVIKANKALKALKGKTSSIETAQVKTEKVANNAAEKLNELKNV